MPKIYICIPVHNRISYTLKCLESIYSQSYSNFTIVICDDGSTDDTSPLIKEQFPEVVLLSGDGNLWWTGGMNATVSYVLENAKEGDYIYTLNNDTELLEDTIIESLNIAKPYKGSAIIGSLNVFYSDPTKVEPSAFKFSRGLLPVVKRVNSWAQDINSIPVDNLSVDGLAGKGVLIPVQVFKKIGLYDFDRLPQYHADLEFSIRAMKNDIDVIINYRSKLLSHVEQTGLGSRANAPRLKDFVKSFFTLRSPHHYRSVINKDLLINDRFYLFHIIQSFSYITLGFIRRYFKYCFKINN